MAALAAASAAVTPACNPTAVSAPRSSLCSSTAPRGLFLGKPLRVVVSKTGSRCVSTAARAATSTDEATTTTSGTGVQTEELIADLKAKWDGIEDKSNVFIYGGGALVALWLSSTIVGAVNSVPLLPKVLELVGLGYTGWFVYKYLLFKESRKELVKDIDELKSKIAGGGKD